MHLTLYTCKKLLTLWSSDSTCSHKLSYLQQRWPNGNPRNELSRTTTLGASMQTFAFSLLLNKTSLHTFLWPYIIFLFKELSKSKAANITEKAEAGEELGRTIAQVRQEEVGLNHHRLFSHLPVHTCTSQRHILRWIHARSYSWTDGEGYST